MMQGHWIVGAKGIFHFCTWIPKISAFQSPQKQKLLCWACEDGCDRGKAW